MDINRDARRIVNRISRSRNAEFLLICGNVDEALASESIAQCEENATLPNVILVLVTLGGEPDAGYRLARYLQNKFRRFSIFIPSVCKSAGTLIAIGAHEIIIGPFGELGPLDVQFYKVDEIEEINSGLVARSAVNALEATAIAMFERYFQRLQQRSDGLITLKTATNIAADFVAKLLSPIYAQINPFTVGENDLAMRVAKDYGERLAHHSRNLKSLESLSALIEGYPSHDFVIDRAEAKGIFNIVRAADDDFLQVTKALGLEQHGAVYEESAPVAMVITRDATIRSEPSSATQPLPLDIPAEQPRQFHKVVKRKRLARS